MGNIVDFNKGKEKVLHKRKIQEIEKKKSTIKNVSKAISKSNKALNIRVVGFYSFLFAVILAVETITSLMIKWWMLNLSSAIIYDSPLGLSFVLSTINVLIKESFREEV